MSAGPRRLAVVLFNLGGPDEPAAVRPFLFNLFNDPAIIGAPWPVRPALAALIAFRRAPVARKIFVHIGGRSPIVSETEAQGAALTQALERAVGPETHVKCFICMRYWRPRAREVAAEVAQYDPDRVVLLPLYPQFSTTTTGSSLAEWRREADRAGLTAPATTLCCYPTLGGFVEAMAEIVGEGLGEFGAQPYRLLFSAHGLPKKIVAKGDPYQWQCERTVEAIVARLGIDGLDWVGCYQSRVGPLEWIGPSTEEEIARAGAEGKAVMVVPMAFVSEHSETLVELDIEYREAAEAAGVPRYVRASTVRAHRRFINGLTDIVISALAKPAQIRGPEGARICPGDHPRCALAGGVVGVGGAGGAG